MFVLDVKIFIDLIKENAKKLDVIILIMTENVNALKDFIRPMRTIVKKFLLKIAEEEMLLLAKSVMKVII